MLHQQYVVIGLYIVSPCHRNQYLLCPVWGHLYPWLSMEYGNLRYKNGDQYSIYQQGGTQWPSVLERWTGDRVVLGSRGRPWRYSVIPRTPDFPTEYQIRRNSNPAGLPVFAAIWGPDFRASTIILTHMFKQIKQIRITLMAMFIVDLYSPN